MFQRSIVIFISSILILALSMTGYFFYDRWSLSSVITPVIPAPTLQPTNTIFPTPVPKVVPSSFIIPLRTHVYQTFNNCGPASLSMLLSYFGQDISQEELGQKLRPYQNQQGDNDDKSVTLEELASEAESRGFQAYHRPGGTIEMLKKFIAVGIPVVLRTWTKIDEDIGHYRVIRGYDDAQSVIIQDDSLQGKDLRFSYDDLLIMWEKFNFEYLVIAEPKKQADMRSILGENTDPRHAWKKAFEQAVDRYSKNPNAIHDGFNASVAAYNTQDYQESIRYFELVQDRLPFRTLWYQIEPIEAYYELKYYAKLFTLTDQVMNSGNRAFSELYILRGRAYSELGRVEEAKSQFAFAEFYNVNLGFY